MTNKRIEPMTSSAVRRVMQSNASGALLVTAHPPRWEKGYNMLVPRSLRLKVSAVFTLAALLSALVTACSSPRSSQSSHAQVLGEIVVTFEGYTQSNGSGVQAVILATNTSSMKLACVAVSYAAGLPLGSTSVVATNLDTETLPKGLVWARRESEMGLDPRVMKRYRIGQVFELPSGEHVRLLLPLYVPQAHPHDFVEHFVLGYRQPSLDDGQAAYDTYVAEVKR
jgi:hypothetical protein